MDVSVPQRVYRKYPGDLLFIPAAVLALCAVLTVAARIPFFWELSRFGRAALIGVIGLLITPLVMAAASAAWRKLTSSQSWQGYMLPALLLITGMVAGLLDFWPVRLPQTLHTVDISFSGPAGSEVRVLEVRDAQGEILPADSYSFSGAWEQGGSAYTARGGQNASINIQFVGSDDGRAQVLLSEGPTAGNVTISIDRTRKQVSLRTEMAGSRLVEAPLLGQSKTGSLLYLAWFVTVGLILPMILIAAIPSGSLTAPPTEKTTELVQGVHSVRHLVFIAIVLLMILQPLRGIRSIDNFDKKFWGREKLLRAYSEIRYRGLGDKIFTSLVVGHDNWLMFTGEMSLDDFQNTRPLQESQLETIRDKIDTLHERLSQRGIKLLVVVAPNKNTIYPEKMPDFIPVLYKKSRLDQLIAYQQAHGSTQILDLRPALLEGKAEREVYYATDTHWNPYGAYIAYREILNALNSNIPALRPHTLDEYRYISSGLRSGDTGIMLGQINVEEEYFRLSPAYRRPQLERWASTAEWSGSIITSAQQDDSLPRLVMYRDSFANELMPFLYDHFSRAVFILHYQVDEAFIYSEQPDVVIIEITERHIISLMDLPVEP